MTPLLPIDEEADDFFRELTERVWSRRPIRPIQDKGDK